MKNLSMQAGRNLLALILMLAALTLPASNTSAKDVIARTLDDVIASKYLRVFVYDDYYPFSFKGKDGKMEGIDVEIAHRMAKKLGVRTEFFVRRADETVDDDLRQNVYKGHYIGGGIADVMMHVPVDNELRRRHPLAVIFGRYYTEQVALLLDPKVVGESETLATFLSHRVGIELDTMADFYLSSPSTLGGRLRAQVNRYRYFHLAVEGLKKGEVGGLMGPRSQLEGAVKTIGRSELKVTTPPFPGMVNSRWNIGMATSHESRDLAYELGDIIIELRESGELKKIFAKYGLTYFKDFLD